MSLTFIAGSSISRKTEKIHETVIRESLRNPEKQYILLVPEQASLMTQQALVDMHPNHALFNIDVLTFNRLSYRVFSEMKVSTKNVLSENGRLMLLKLVLSRHENELTALKKGAHRIGFLNELKSVMSELSQYNVDPETLQEKAEKVGEPVLKQKLHDVCILYSAYLKLLHENYALSEEKLALLSEKIGKWVPVKNTVFVLDGYTGFTPPQYRVLDALIENSAGVILGITMGTGASYAENASKEDLFYMPSHMREEAALLAEAHNMKAEDVFVSEPEDSEYAAELRYLERALFRRPKPKKTQAEEAAAAEHAAVRIFRAKNRKEEIAAALSQILSSIREEETLPDGNKTRKYTYNDLAIVTGDPEGYREELEAQFSEAGIPYFIDSPKPLINDPLFRFVKDLIALSDHDFRFNEVFSLVKNPIVLKWLRDKLQDRKEGAEPESEAALPVGLSVRERLISDSFSARERLLEVENYALARGIRGRSAYEKAWQGGYKNFRPDRLPFVNETKDLLFPPLIAFSKELKAAASVSGQLQAVRNCLSSFCADEAMAAFAEEASDEAGRREYSGAPELLKSLLQEIDTILGREMLSPDEFSDVLLTGISGTALRLAPPTKDRLVVGDLMRTRLGNVKKLFVLGANEGLLPRISDGAGILTDRDRELLEEQELKLANTAKEETFFAHFYLYLLLTKPTEALTVFYAASDDAGTMLSPSFAVSELMAVFKNSEDDDDPISLKPEQIPHGDALMNTKSTVYRALAGELRAYREDGRAPVHEAQKEKALKKLAAHYAWAFGDDEERTMRIFDALFYHYEEEKYRLDRDLAVRLYGKELTGSVSRLETFAACPYKHFLDRGIRLKEQQIFEADNRNIGTLFHDSVEAFFNITKEENKAWETLNDAERLTYVKKSVERAVEKDETGVLSGTARNRYLQKHVERVTDRSLKTIQYQWNAGGFEKIEAEVPFNSRELKAFSLPLSEGVVLSLRGKIDRIDTAEKDGKVYIRVVDYKTSEHKVDYTQIYYGLQLQLLLYLKAAEERAHRASPDQDVVPAGVYYYVLQDKAVKEEKVKKAGGSTEDVVLSSMRMEGITNREDSSVELTDREMADRGQASKASSRVASYLTRLKNGKLQEPRKGSDSFIMTSEELKGLSEFALSKAKALSEEIISGDISVRPTDAKENCANCAYSKFCGFNGQIPGYREKRTAKRVYQDLLQKAPGTGQETPESKESGNMKTPESKMSGNMKTPESKESGNTETDGKEARRG